jgi:hypothetical protein
VVLFGRITPFTVITGNNQSDQAEQIRQPNAKLFAEMLTNLHGHALLFATQSRGERAGRHP